MLIFLSYFIRYGFFNDVLTAFIVEYADRYTYSCRKKIQLENYDLCLGKRGIIVAGKLGKRYKIMVPKEVYG